VTLILTFIYELEPYSLEIYRMCENELIIIITNYCDAAVKTQQGTFHSLNKGWTKLTINHVIKH